MNKVFTSLFIFFVSFSLCAQNVITGVVRDENGETLPGATILEKGTSNGVVTNPDGQFTIRVNPGATLSVSFVGYLSESVEVQDQSVVNFDLTPDVQALAEIIVVGYGTQKKSDLTGTVATISPNRIDAKPNTNFTQALQGALPGINITTNASGAEQNNVNILIRGRNSINAANGPLIVLDGVPYTGNISDINTVDIESMSVLRDASSTAIYGSRGANGVILIETKKGASSQGKPTITYSGYYGITELGNIPDIYDGEGFALFKEQREPGELTDSELEVLTSGQSTDWLDLATQTGTKQEHTLSVAGASERINYYVSMSYLDAEGVSINDHFERVTLRVNLNFDITDNLKFGTSTQLTRIDRSGLDPDFSGDGGAFFMNPLTSAKDENGNLTVFPWPEDEFFGNPLAPTLAINDNINNKIFTTNYLEYSFPFVEGLSYKLNTGVEYGSRNEGTYFGRNTADGANRNGEAEVRNQVDENYLIENIINYSRNFGDHSVTFTGLYSAQKIRTEENTTEGVNFPSDILGYRQLNFSGENISSEVDFEQRTLISQMGRFNYGYQGKYLLTFTVRRDGYSGFGENNKYGVFPSAAFGWNISDESFFPDGFVSQAKLRLSYGENGNQSIGPYSNLALLNDRSYVTNDEGEDQVAAGFVPDQLENDDLTWETTATANIGLDLGFLENRFQLSIDAYQANTRDLLLQRRIPSANGITSIVQNVGETKNTGIELSLTGYAVNKGDFSWNFNGNISYNKNEIVSLFGENEDDISNNLFIGQPIQVNYGFVFDGIWQEGDDIANSAEPFAVPGDVRTRDIDNPLDNEGNPIVGISNDFDRAIQGQRDPKFIWGLENTWRYKNISLYVFAHAVSGVTRRNTLRDVNVFGEVRRNWYVLDYWTPENPINTYHRNSIDANINNVRFYEDADFIRIKDVTLSYTFNDKLFGSTGFKNARVYFTARNLLTITDWEGLDPELGNQNAVPLQKEFILGLNIGLQ
ncbi:MAG: TonB-dependent receptor [Bacteroidota bacterium]